MSQVQRALFQAIRELFPKDSYSLVDDISSILHIEKSTAYKRINGDTPLKIEEVALLCNHFNISMDNLIFNESMSNIISFHHNDIVHDVKSFQDFLERFVATFDTMRLGLTNTLIIQCNDVPPFHLFAFPALSRFLYESFRLDGETRLSMPRSFSKLEVEEGELALLQYLTHEYNTHPSIEIYSREQLYALLQRILMAVRSKWITKELGLDLIRQIRILVDLMLRNCENGGKYDYYLDKKLSDSTFLYNPYFLEGGIKIFYRTDGYEKAYVMTDGTSFLATQDLRYTQFLKKKLDIIRSNSSNITNENLMERRELFNTYHEQIAAFKTRITNLG